MSNYFWQWTAVSWQVGVQVVQDLDESRNPQNSNLKMEVVTIFNPPTALDVQESFQYLDLFPAFALVSSSISSASRSPMSRFEADKQYLNNILKVQQCLTWLPPPTSNPHSPLPTLWCPPIHPRSR